VSAVYLETSAVLRWLLGESDAQEIAARIQEAAEPVCSVLTILETHRVLIRAERERPSRGRQLGLLRRQLAEASADWNVLEITPQVCVRAGEPFPVEPVRTLDAIHLATALHFARAFPGLSVLTFDERIVVNLDPLGLLQVEADA
jgi:predicted nucleic acid-binding protein